MPDPQIPEAVVSLIHAVREDEALREFLFKFERSSDPARRMAFAQMAAQMRSAGEDEEVAAAIGMLGNPELYSAACAALRELEEE
jgi:hypothetical protein